MTSGNNSLEQHSKTTQFITFSLGTFQYAIDVLRVQEATVELHTTPVPLAPDYVKGLVNLRGQVSTAIDLKQLFELKNLNTNQKGMMVVCKIDGQLISLLVDRIGDVVEIPQNAYESVPDTVARSVKMFLGGVYKLDNALLSVIDIDKLSNQINNNEKQEKLRELA